jgi:hypothetical protein
MVATKASFFMSKRTMAKRLIPEAKVTTESKQVVFAKPRRFLYEQGTDSAYAEIVGNTAVCLMTGMDMFQLGGGREEYAQSSAPFQRRFDFTPPDGKRHPDERYVDVHGLVKAGIISDSDVASHRAFSDEELKEAMAKLEQYRAEMEQY